MSLLRCTGISKRFGDTVVLDGVSLEVSEGASVVLLGSSGSGKTTLLRIIAGLDAADAGTVELGGRVLSDPRPQVMPENRRIGMVFQALELWPHMTVAEHITFGLEGRPRGRAAARHTVARELIARVGLDLDVLARRPDTLSGGERQRVAIARTLAAEPRVILYDEPLANLDPDRRDSLRILIRELAREQGTTVVYVTHDAAEAQEMGDEVAVLSHGSLVEQQPPHELYRNPRTLIGARALGAVTALTATWDGAVAQTALGALKVGDAEHASTIGDALAVLRPESIDVVDEGGVAGTITAVRPRGALFSFDAQVGDESVLGQCVRAVRIGDTVRLAATAPACLVPASADRLREAS